MRIFKLSALTFVLLLVASCDAYTSVRGEIQGPDCQPVAGAVVKLEIGDHVYSESESDVAGAFEVQTVHGRADEVLIVISKPGFKEKVIRLHPYFRYEDLVVQLEPEQKNA